MDQCLDFPSLDYIYKECHRFRSASLCVLHFYNWTAHAAQLLLCLKAYCYDHESVTGAYVLFSGVTGGTVPPETSDREISADTYQEKEARKKWKRGNFFFFFFCLFAFHFSKRRKFVLGLPKWKILYRGKNSRREKNQEKWLCPLRKFSWYAPGTLTYIYVHNRQLRSSNDYLCLGFVNLITRVLAGDGTFTVAT